MRCIDLHQSLTDPAGTTSLKSSALVAAPQRTAQNSLCWRAPRRCCRPFGYGVNGALFVVALRELATARTGAYFSTAPMVEGRAAIQAAHQGMIARGVQALALDVVDVIEVDDLAVEIGRYTLMTQPPGGVPVIVRCMAAARRRNAQDRGGYVYERRAGLLAPSKAPSVLALTSTPHHRKLPAHAAVADLTSPCPCAGRPVLGRPVCRRGVVAAGELGCLRQRSRFPR